MQSNDRIPAEGGGAENIAEDSFASYGKMLLQSMLRAAPEQLLHVMLVLNDASSISKDLSNAVSSTLEVNR